MKQFLLRISTRVDALSLRERVMLFAAVLTGVVFLSYWLMLGPMFDRQEELSANIARQQKTLAQIEAEIGAVAARSSLDPDAANRARLAVLQTEIRRLSSDLRSMQQSLVEPEGVAPLLETMMRSSGKLKLVALRTLPVTGLSEALPSGEPAAPAASAAVAAPPSLPPEQLAQAWIAQAAAGKAVAPAGTAGTAPAGAAAAAPQLKLPELVYRHGVELTLEGEYLDLVRYVAGLEATPVRLIWGRARLDAGAYPRSRLKLTLFTLSLDKDWMKL